MVKVTSIESKNAEKPSMKQFPSSREVELGVG